MPAIEGNKILLCSRKIVPKNGPPIYYLGIDNRTKYLSYAFSLNRNGNGEILSEYSPKQPKFLNDSLLSRNDSINGFTLWGVSKYRIKKNNIEVGSSVSRTSTHSNQSATILENCLLVVIVTNEKKVVATYPVLKQYI